MKFRSQYELGPEMMSFSQDQIKQEPMFFNCEVSYAYEAGGPITRNFINNLDSRYYHGILDSRVHMLMPGWYPCIPGWHHDDVPRSTQNGQPNYKNPEYFSKHCLALQEADIAPTEFLSGDIELPEPSSSGSVYHQWDVFLESTRNQGIRTHAPDRRLIYFDADTLHRGTTATRTGWRWFARVSIDTNRKPTNEIRKQVQVYMSALNAGW